MHKRWLLERVRIHSRIQRKSQSGFVTQDDTPKDSPVGCLALPATITNGTAAVECSKLAEILSQSIVAT